MISFCLLAAILTHLAASNGNEIWAIVSESGIPAAAQPVTAAPAAPVVPEKDKGRLGKGGKNTRANTAAPKTKTPVAAAPAPAEIVFESGGMSAACTRVLNLFEDIVDKFPHTVPPLETKQVLLSVPPDSVSSHTYSVPFAVSYLCLTKIHIFVCFSHRARQED